MLIDAAIVRGLATGALRAARPVAVRAPHKRRFLMCRPLYGAIDAGRVDPDAEMRKALGGLWSAQFEHEKLACEDHWKAAGLPTEPPPGAFTAAPNFAYASYITENARRSLEVPK